MTTFSNLKSIKSLPGKLTEAETIRALRLLLADEHEAICQYESIIESTDNDIVKKIATEIRKDELKHAGNIEFALQTLSEDDYNGIVEGVAEAEKTLGKE